MTHSLCSASSIFGNLTAGLERKRSETSLSVKKLRKADSVIQPALAN
jgi:hypothetical protein